jgi:glycosyltransferase involved in cell wall biosynthesis
MKILIVTTSYPRDNGDMSGIFIKRLAAAMVRAGAKVTVLAPGDRNAKSEEVDNDIHIVRFAYAPRSLMRIAYGNGGVLENLKHYPYLYILLPFFLISLVVNSILLTRKCDLIHANWLITGLLLLFVGKLMKKPIVVTLRGSDVQQKSKIFDLLLNKVDAITTVNQQWTKDLQKKGTANAFYTPNGVAVINKPIACREKFGFISGEIIVLYIGALREVKGIDVLQKVARKMEKLNKNVRFVIAGPGDSNKFNIFEIENITCLGMIQPDKIFELYASSDIFILPSRHEGRPNALIEAMASGLPSVATRLPGVLEVLTDESGIMVDIENPSAMAQAICGLANNPKKRKTMGGRAKARIKELSLDWNTSATTYLNIFKEILSCAE